MMKFPYCQEAFGLCDDKFKVEIIVYRIAAKDPRVFEVALIAVDMKIKSVYKYC